MPDMKLWMLNLVGGVFLSGCFGLGARYFPESQDSDSVEFALGASVPFPLGGLGDPGPSYAVLQFYGSGPVEELSLGYARGLGPEEKTGYITYAGCGLSHLATGSDSGVGVYVHAGRTWIISRGQSAYYLGLELRCGLGPDLEDLGSRIDTDNVQLAFTFFFF